VDKKIVWSEKGFIINAGKPEKEGGYDEWFVLSKWIKEATVWFHKYNSDDFYKTEKNAIESALDCSEEPKETAYLLTRLNKLKESVVVSVDK